MTYAKEEHVYFIIPIRGKFLIGIAYQVFVYLIEEFARIALAVDKTDLYLRMIDQDPDHFSTGVPGASNNACFDGCHITQFIIL